MVLRSLALAVLVSAGLGVPVAFAGASGPGLQLNQFFYRSGDSITAIVEPDDEARGSRPLAGTQFGPGVLLIGEQQGDVEVLAYADGHAARSTATNQPVTVAAGPAVANDGVLQLLPGERVFAYLFWNRKGRPQASVAIGAAWGGVRPGLVRIAPELARGVQGGDRSGVVAGTAGVVEIATDHLIYHPRSAGEQERLLRLTRGRVTKPASRLGAVGVSFDPMPLFSDSAPAILSFMGSKEVLTASSTRAAAMYAAALILQLQGFRVAVNPVMQWHGPAFSTQDAVGNYVANYLSGGDIRERQARLPGMREAWIYTWLFDLDHERVKVAFIDSGFAPNRDFRGLTAGTIWQCDYVDKETSDPSACAFGGALGPAVGNQTVGNSFVGEKTWHGTGVVTAGVGILNNGYGGAGSGGQVGVPMLYRVGLRTYALQMGDVIGAAARDGAAVINISAGFPCRIFKVAAAPYEICNAAGRAQFLHDLWASAMALANTVCGPFPLSLICLGTAAYLKSDLVDIIADAGAADVRANLASAVAEANQKGVVIVASGGNIVTDGFLCTIIDCDDHNADHYQLIPCVVDGVICASALFGTPGTYRNSEFFGSTIRVWAPTEHAYYSPLPDTIPPGDPFPPVSDHLRVRNVGGASGAAPVVSGAAALLVAAQPNLNRTNPQLTASEVASIPGRIQTIIESTAVRTADAQDPSLELRILNPYAAMRVAFQGTLPDPVEFAGPRWFLDPDTPTLGECGTDEGLAFPNVVLALNESCGGSIVTIMPGEGITAPMTVRADIDITGWRVPGDGRYRTTITVTSPSRSKYGYVGIDGDLGELVAVSPDGSEAYNYMSLPYFPQDVPRIRIRGIQLSDNVYRIAVGAGERLPDLLPDRFDDANTHPLNIANNDIMANAAPIGRGLAPGDPDGWEGVGSGGSKRISLSGLNFHTSQDVDWFLLKNLPDDLGRNCGSVLSVTAPDDIVVQIYAAQAPSSTPMLASEGRKVASLIFGPNTPPGAEVYLALKSQSHAALEYGVTIQLTYINPVACQFARTATLAPMPPILRWPLAARPAALFFDHLNGALRVWGRLLAGASATVELLDPNGRRVWLREIGDREIGAAARGGLSLDVTTESLPPGTYHLLLRSADPTADFEVGHGPPPLARGK